MAVSAVWRLVRPPLLKSTITLRPPPKKMILLSTILPNLLCVSVPL